MTNPTKPLITRLTLALQHHAGLTAHQAGYCARLCRGVLIDVAGEMDIRDALADSFEDTPEPCVGGPWDGVVFDGGHHTAIGVMRMRDGFYSFVEGVWKWNEGGKR